MRLTVLANVVAAMRVPIRDANYLVAHAGATGARPSGVNLDVAWQTVRSDISRCCEAYSARYATRPPQSPGEALIADTARYGAGVIRVWLSALDAIRAKQGAFAALGALLPEAERIGRSIADPKRCPTALVTPSRSRMPPSSSPTDLLGILYGLKVEGRDIVVIERTTRASEAVRNPPSRKGIRMIRQILSAIAVALTSFAAVAQMPFDPREVFAQQNLADAGRNPFALVDGMFSKQFEWAETWPGRSSLRTSSTARKTSRVRLASRCSRSGCSRDATARWCSKTAASLVCACSASSLVRQVKQPG